MHTRASSLLRAAAALALAFGLPACLESEERITVREDGSIAVELRAEGRIDDLADGYPLPLHGPWQPRNDAARAWLALVGRDTGSAATRANLAALPDTAGLLPRDGDVKLLVGAEFARAEDLPRGWAPPSEPFADAYQQRGAALAIERKNGRRVYVFERTLGAREFARYDPWTRMQAELGDDTLAKLERAEAGELDDAQCAEVVDAAVRALREGARALGEDALASIYVDGGAELAARDHAACLEAIARALDAVLTPERVRGMLDRARASEHDADDDSAVEFVDLERDLRDALRRALADGLERVGVPLATRNGALGQLEWLFTAADQTTDLGDEGLIVRVRMPGELVGGNFERREGDEVVWEIPGKELRDRARVLRVVSVVE